MGEGRRTLASRRVWMVLATAVLAAACAAALFAPAGALAGSVAPRAFGGLDCNGYSPIQKPIRTNLACRDLRNSAEFDDRFWDNGHYIGHDEPTLNFTSSAPGSGADSTWTFTLGADPAGPPTVSSPGHDISHYFELTPAIWFSMNLCDPNSYPQLPCTPESDKNAPRCANQAECTSYPGAGSAFLEMQFYPPGFAPWIDAISADNKHWAAALNIDSLESTQNFGHINEKCPEPVNFAWIQSDGVPTGPPSPQLATLASNTPNAKTLLMNPGDTIRVHIFNAAAPGGGKALKIVIDDLTTHQSGFMQASAANGFMNSSIVDCSGTPFNFEPEYSTAKPTNTSPWGAGTQVISMAFETGHFTPCSSVRKRSKLTLFPGVTDFTYNQCVGSYEEAAPPDEETLLEESDAQCYPEGDEHGALAAGSPDTMTGCIDALKQNGDLDFDGSPYWTEWPTSTGASATPASFQISSPTTGRAKENYSAFQFQTDAAFSEIATCSPKHFSGCAVPPPNAPGKFYPYWTQGTASTGACVWEFGNVQSGNTFGGDAQYGKLDPNLLPDLISRFRANNCTSG